jgi:hypothetical protein
MKIEIFEWHQSTVNVTKNVVNVAITAPSEFPLVVKVLKKRLPTKKCTWLIQPNSNYVIDILEIFFNFDVVCECF